MRTVLTRAAGVLLAGALASAVHAADARPAAAPVGPEVHKMVILNGPTYSAHYFSVGLSSSDRASLRDLERAENDAYYADDLQALRREYVAQELVLAPHRASVQQALYGRSVTRSYDYAATSAYGPGYYGGFGGFGAYPGYGYGGYGYGYDSSSAFAGSSSTINQSLANGVGDEGTFKTAMAPVIAGQANAEFATAAGRVYTAAINRAGESDALRTALGLNPRGPNFTDHQVVRRVSVTMKPGLGDKIEGNLVDEDNDTLTVETATDEVTVRKADVVRIDRHKK